MPCISDSCDFEISGGCNIIRLLPNRMFNNLMGTNIITARVCWWLLSLSNNILFQEVEIGSLEAQEFQTSQCHNSFTWQVLDKSCSTFICVFGSVCNFSLSSGAVCALCDAIWKHFANSNKLGAGFPKHFPASCLFVLLYIHKNEDL